MSLPSSVRRAGGLLAVGALVTTSTVLGGGVALAEPGGFDSADGITEYVVPADVCAVTWQIFGGGGGADVSDNPADPNRERRVTTFVSEGQVFTLAPGTAGLSVADGSAAGTNTAYPAANGGPGDGANGGGGGAASVVLDGDGQVYLYAYGVNGAGADADQYGAGGTVEGVGTGAEWIDPDSEDFSGDSEVSGVDGRILGTEVACGDGGGGYEPPANEPPLAPVGVTAQPGDGQLRVSFSENFADGVDAVTSWEYELDTGAWTPVDVADDYGSWAFTLDGLTNGQSYTVRVRGVSEISGAGAPSDPVTATPYEPLAAPTGVEVSTTPSALDITWDAPGPGGTFDLDGYEVIALWSAEERGGMYELCTTDAATRECYAGVPAGDEYQVLVMGIDSEGNAGLNADPVSTGVVPFPEVPDSVPTADAPLEGVSEGAALTNGETVTIRGDGFLPNSTIQAVIYSTPTPLGSFTVDAAGAFEIEVTIPDGLHAGEHSLVVSGLDPSGNPRYLRTDVTVSAAEDLLAYTGATVVGPALGGLAAIVVGSGLLVASRRRATA